MGVSRFLVVIGHMGILANKCPYDACLLKKCASTSLGGCKSRLFFVDLVADHAANGCTTYSPQRTTASQYRTAYRTDTSA